MPAEPTEVVRAFYAAAASRDAAALDELVTTGFHADAAIVWPEGLPYGGRVEGAARIGKVFAGLAAPSTPLGPDNLKVLSLVDGGDRVAAQLAFDWRVHETSIATGALELWSFDEAGLVTELRAYYWDTAACQALLRSAQAPSA